jgi:molybdopterin converting factor subunit 1
MRVKVLYFAVLRDLCGQVAEEIELPAGESVGGLLKLLESRSATGKAVANKVWSAIAVAVNQEYAQGSLVLQDGDEVALLPPVSGGCIAVGIAERWAA